MCASKADNEHHSNDTDLLLERFFEGTSVLQGKVQSLPDVQARKRRGSRQGPRERER